MNFQKLLEYNSPRGFPKGTCVWEFNLSGLRQPALVRGEDTGYYTSNEEGCSKTFIFDDFEKFKEAYIVAHRENIRRGEGNTEPFLEIGPMISYEWPLWGKDYAP